eukprot:RCo011259
MGSLPEYFETQRGSPLLPQECAMLRHLSAQGVAKVNADMCRGIHVNRTLSDLMAAYEVALAEKHILCAALSEDALGVLLRFGRNLSLGELLYLSLHTPTASTGSSPEGLSLAEVVSDQAAALLLSQLLGRARALRDTYSRNAGFSLLAPTSPPPSLLGADSPTQRPAPTVVRLGLFRVHVSLNPVFMWFEGVGEGPKCQCKATPKPGRVRRTRGVPETRFVRFQAEEDKLVSCGPSAPHSSPTKTPACPSPEHCEQVPVDRLPSSGRLKQRVRHLRLRLLRLISLGKTSA